MTQLSEEQMITKITQWLGTGSINIFGMQFSGKDTQGEHLAHLFNAPLLGGGDILRNSVITEDLREALNKGLYVDSKEYIQIITPYLSKLEFKNKPLILSSVGRWIGEEEAIIGATQVAKHVIKAVVHLEIEESVAYRRMELADRGRDDDHHENLKSRINEFRIKTIPVIEVYGSKNLLITVDGNQSQDKVTSDILKALYKRATS